MNFKRLIFGALMKKTIHPKYQDILFVDSTTGYKFVCGSTLQPEGKETYKGAELPVYYLSTSSASHPFFTGSKQLVDAEGRVDKFKKRYAASQQKSKDASEEKEKNKGQEQKNKGQEQKKKK